MLFHEQLNYYIDLYHISGKELAKTINISEASMSRYRTGKTTPIKDSELISTLAEAISKYSDNPEQTYNKIYTELNNSCSENDATGKIIIKNLNYLCDTLNINNRQLANYLHYDPSFISRIKSGQRLPSDIDEFISKTADFIIINYQDENSVQIISELTKTNYTLSTPDKEKHTLLTKWFTTNESFLPSNVMTHFLSNLNDFNLEDYIKAIHFDELKVPTVPFTFNTSKQYYGIKEMCTGELDFLKATVLSKSMADVYMCSDMPMDDMAEIEDFPKKWMFGLALILKKGLHINIIHNLDRPFNEMMLGLEAWIPLYMTGQVSPYYLKGKHNTLYCRINYASGTAALSGECISGHHNDGKYYVTKKPSEVDYYKNKAKLLFDKALPLMKIYKKENESEFNTFILKDINNKGNRDYILSIPPIYTLKENTFKQICKRSNLSSEEISTLIELRKKRLEYFETIAKNNTVSIKLYIFSEEDFKEDALTLAVSESFIEKDISYTYEEYLEHIEDTKKLSSYENVTVELINTKGFKNLQISIKDNEYAMISKEKTPAIHFVINHPKLIDALKNMVIPYMD